LRHATNRPDARLMSLRQAEAESGIPKDSLRKLIADSSLPAVELPGIRRVLIDRQDLNDLIEQSKRRAA